MISDASICQRCGKDLGPFVPVESGGIAQIWCISCMYSEAKRIFEDE